MQTEDELAAINWAIGAALTGARAATSTSGPGFSLMVEGLGWAGNNEVPVGGTYDHIICEQPWIRDRQTYGQSQCPWCCPFWGKEITYEGSCPNARRAIDTHLVMGVHEGYTEREIKDIAAALRKVETHYLK